MAEDFIAIMLWFLAFFLLFGLCWGMVDFPGLDDPMKSVVRFVLLAAVAVCLVADVHFAGLLR